MRIALCSDPGQAEGTQLWNHANVLCLSNRTLADDLPEEILSAWFGATLDGRGDAGIDDLTAVEARHLRRSR